MEMATIGAQSLLWLVLVSAILAAVAVTAFIIWSLRPVPVYLSERVKTGSPFDVEFWIENSSPWFAMSHLSITCVLSYPAAPDLPPPPAHPGTRPAAPPQPDGSRAGRDGVFKVSFPRRAPGDR